MLILVFLKCDNLVDFPISGHICIKIEGNLMQ